MKRKRSPPRLDRIPDVEVVIARRPGSPKPKPARATRDERTWAPQKGRFDEWTMLDEALVEIRALKAELDGPHFCACGDELHCYGCDTIARNKPNGYVRAEIKKVFEIKGRGFGCDIDVNPPLVVGDCVRKKWKKWTVVGVERHPFRGLLLRCESAPLALLEEGPCEVERKS